MSANNFWRMKLSGIREEEQRQNLERLASILRDAKKVQPGADELEMMEKHPKITNYLKMLKKIKGPISETKLGLLRRAGRALGLLGCSQVEPNLK